MTCLARELHQELKTLPSFSVRSKVLEVIGPVIKASIFPAAVGDRARIESRDGGNVWDQIS